ncbi:peptidoglycan-binding protein [Lysinibacter cavernae]|uniref:Multidrug efflux pump subunit AcrA (Membrane-fusion protein) n=1 Tax=Lysinibacter cavernae TaxID=1640652 RepID=A0A7X5R291_9MICO|nr:peptidoglycan-binding protein [Lysinibacter cavernae]NIH54162.1 multidrug efflux pump subunit AcrA (membrane-fusion protein) [Lysinibacter cavernae]
MTSETRKRSRPLLIGLGAFVLVGAVVAGIMLSRPPAPAEATKPDVEVTTASVSRGELTERVRAKGKLAFTNARKIGSSKQGTVTWLPDIGSVLAQGQALFYIDNEPVVLFRGTLPAWRSFEQGMTDGPDVQQLEQNLLDLGFLDGTPGETFNWLTTAAIKAWQKSIGLEQTGTIAVGDILFVPSDVRVTDHVAAAGDQAGPELMTVTNTDKRVSASIETAQSELAVVGASVSLQLPDGTQTTGTIESVGSPVEEETPMGGKTLKIPIQVRPDDAAIVAALNNITVTAVLTQVKRDDALILPVTALLAQPGGGFAVERVTGTGTKRKTATVPVELGAFADGQVEVVGGDLAEGDTVVVAE